MARIIRLKTWAENVRNQTEKILLPVLKEIIQENPNWGWDHINFQDVYGCTINMLPVCYSYPGNESVQLPTKEEVRTAILAAMDRVQKNPLSKSID